MMLYFAYGSNINWEQIKNRCPSAQFVCTAVLKDYRLAFTRSSKTRQCGVADVINEPGQVVWGVIYKISNDDVVKLDLSEGFRPDRRREENSYVREELCVYKEGNEEKPVLVSIYIANKQKKPPLPNDNYKQLILNGAKYWHFPEEYIRFIEQIKVAERGHAL